jgi:hypothetical protein
MRITDEKIIIKGLKSLEVEPPPSLYSDVMLAVRTYQEKKNPFVLWAGIGSAAVAVVALAIFMAVPKTQPEIATFTDQPELSYGMTEISRNMDSGDSFESDSMVAKNAPGSESLTAISDESQSLGSTQPKMLMLSTEGFVLIKTISLNPDFCAREIQNQLSLVNPTLSSTNGTRMVTMLVPSDKLSSYIDQIAQTNCQQSNYMEVQKLQDAPAKTSPVRILVQISK